MKKFLFLSLTCLLAVALVLPACGAPAPENVIKIGVCGPMEWPQGEGHWFGAVKARDEINAAGGVTIGGEQYFIELVKSDNNEILSVTDAASAMDRLITVDQVDFVVGGFRTESVFAMQEVAMDYQMLFINCGAATMALCKQVADDYDRYKYFFRGTPFNEYFLINNDFMLLSMVAAQLRKELGVGKPKVAIIAEKVEWTEAMVGIAQGKLPGLGMEVTGTWRPSDTATDVNAALTEIAATEPHIIFTTFSGPVGITYGKAWGQLEIPACSVGINVEGQKSGYLEATEGYGMYDCFLGGNLPTVAITDKTIPFVKSFIEETGQLPLYTVATYDAILNLMTQVEAAQTLDADALIPLLEKSEFDAVGGHVAYYPVGSVCPACPHDLVYGPGNLTGQANQWQDDDPIYGQKGVWPQDFEGMPDEWRGWTYEGIVPYVIPPRVVDYWKGRVPEEAPPEEEAPPAEGEPSFKAAEYANAEYGFSIKYPANWAEQESETATYVAASPAQVPVVIVQIVDGATFADALNAGYSASGFSEIEVTSESETTLADGTPATEAVTTYMIPQGFPADAFSLGVQADGKWVVVTVMTVSVLAPYDEALFSEIAHTLTFE